MPYPSFTIDPNALIPLTTAKEHLNIKETDTSQDNVLIRMINASSNMVELFLDRKIIQRTFTEYYDGRGNNRILLRQWPVVKPTQLWDDTSSKFTDTNNQFATTEYEVDGDGEGAVGVVLVDGRTFSKGTRNIKVVYQGGYTLATVPYAITEACVLHVEYMFDMRSDRRIGVVTKGKNQESTTFAGDLPEFVKKMLYPYQRVEAPLAYVGVMST